MRAVILQAVSSLLIGAVAGSVASQLGWPRRDLLLEGEADSGPLWLVLGVLGPLLLLILSVIGGRVAAYSISPRLAAPRIRWFFYGCTASGFAIGFCLMFLWTRISDPITPGRTNPPSYSDAPATAWDATQWFIYLAPPIVHILAAVVAVAMILLGLRGSRELAAAANEAMRRRRQALPPGGSKLTGKVVAAEPAPHDPNWTRIVAQVTAPDGVRQVEALAAGTEREWLPGAKALVYVSHYAPYDPNQTLIEARRLVRAQGFFASACPPPLPTAAAAGPGR